MILAQLEGQPLVDWEWVFGHLDDIWAATSEHLLLTGIALGVGLAISLALSLVALLYRKAYTPITWVTGILYTIPSLALFSMLVPVTGLSVLTAEIGLVGYTLLILIRNIMAGIDGVDPAVKEAAIGMGYTRRRVLFQIEFPLALPVIIAGIRIASVTTIGLVTVAALIGKGGLGFFILQGLRRFFTTEIVVGAVMSVVLAIVIDSMLLVVQRALTPWIRAKATV
ncbi:MAG TPA: ABC transporter permease [Acidimicrobiia bacterium]|nr:ABC transporter permease [Acidimicrobiia bacterium]